jgi:predicted nucleic acid-binding protein
MPSYYDSSFLLSGLLQQSGAENLVPYWDEEENRLSSHLLEAECVTVLRRAAELQETDQIEIFQSTRFALLDEYLASVTLKPVDDEVISCLRQEPRLAGCRTLDAIHLATALLYQAHCEEPITVITLDDKMKQLATHLDFRIAP